MLRVQRGLPPPPLQAWERQLSCMKKSRLRSRVRWLQSLRQERQRERRRENLLAARRVLRLLGLHRHPLTLR
eukprot:5083972-Pleurochrysis_carterae.AAC.7